MIKKYRKKPIAIDAVQWTGDNLAELRKLEGFNAVHTCFSGKLNINTYEGVMNASVGDYIIKGVQGEFYPCKPDIFEQTYEEVRDSKTEEQPTIEPERKTGKWIVVDDGIISGKCSVCGWEAYMYEDDVVGMDYCPNCGARMEEDNG